MPDELAVFHLEGLNHTLKAFRKLNDGAAREVRTELRGGVATHFVADVKSRIDSVGLHATGRLYGSIKPSVRGSDVFVQSRPPLKPGPRSRMGYAAVWEFGRGGARAYLGPVYQAWIDSGRLERELEGFVKWLGSEWRN